MGFGIPSFRSGTEVSCRFLGRSEFGVGNDELAELQLGEDVVLGGSCMELFGSHFWIVLFQVFQTLFVQCLDFFRGEVHA
ncbi:hypothetical protein TALC_00092 [Thermoplasmatales archaeon BRNA1]|nr:hypothetical protein TALC_00092 [Thermoplasmatales archaeon BRNA1]